MPTTSSIRRLDAGAATLLFDLRRGYAELVAFGPRLPANEDCEALCDTARRAPHESEPDLIVPNSVLPLRGSGYAGTSAVELCRAGRELPLFAAPLECVSNAALAAESPCIFQLPAMTALPTASRARSAPQPKGCPVRPGGLLQAAAPGGSRQPVPPGRQA